MGKAWPRQFADQLSATGRNYGIDHVVDATVDVCACGDNVGLVTLIPRDVVTVNENEARARRDGRLAGGEAFAGWSATASLCYAFTPSGQSGFLFSAGGGGGGPWGANALIGPMISNAQNLSDLGGPFGYAEGSAGEGPYGAGVQVSVGENGNGKLIWEIVPGWAPSLRMPLPVPFTAGGGVTGTWTFGQVG